MPKSLSIFALPTVRLTLVATSHSRYLFSESESGSQKVKVSDVIFRSLILFIFKYAKEVVVGDNKFGMKKCRKFSLCVKKFGEAGKYFPKKSKSDQMRHFF